MESVILESRGCKRGCGLKKKEWDTGLPEREGNGGEEKRERLENEIRNSRDWPFGDILKSLHFK